jgi:hypothetical protein
MMRSKKLTEMNDAEFISVIRLRDKLKEGKIMPYDFTKVKHSFGLQGRPSVVLKELNDMVEGEIARRGNHANIA